MLPFSVLSALLSLSFGASVNGTSSSGGSASSTTSTAVTVFTQPANWTKGVAQEPTILNGTAPDPNELANGYDLISVSTSPAGLTGTLRLRGEAKNLYGYDYQYLFLNVSYQAKERLNVRITPQNASELFLLPESVVALPQVENLDLNEADLMFEYQKENFGFAIIRKSSGEALFDTRGNPLVYENQFIQFNTTLPNDHVISGLGETFDKFQLVPGTNRTLYSNDNGNPIGHDIYGVHPVYYDQRYSSNTTHAVWWRGSAIQEVLVRETSLTWRALSGAIDLYFFSGPKPFDAVEQYVKAVGLPGLQQYWTLGYHQCRWGYNSVDRLSEVVDRFNESGIALETIWSDIDWMEGKRNFVNDHVNFATDDLRDFLSEIHDQGKHWVPMIDSAIYIPNPTNASDAYLPYDYGHDMDVFLKNPDGSEYIGAVWPGFTVFPDYFANSSQDYWSLQFKKFHKSFEFDGIWRDMQSSSFCVGSCGTGYIDRNPIAPSFMWGNPSPNYPGGFNLTNGTDFRGNKTANTTFPNSLKSVPASEEHNQKMHGKGNINYPPYAINYYQGSHDLATHIVAPNATHQNGFVEYDLNGVTGGLEAEASYKALLDISPDKRPFVVIRTTFTGSGRWTAHWGGDNLSDWPWAELSISQAFAMGSFGIPFFGVDACGFSSNSDMELCSRWMQLASFFPFYRNHNTLGANDQEPYVWAETAESTRTAMAIRYLLLPHHYTLLHHAHVTGVPVLRPLRWVFPDDKFYSPIENQFFVGDSLLVTPVLQPNVSTVKGVFPNAGVGEVYYDWYTKEAQNFSSHSNHTLQAPLGHITLHIRGGAVLPTQEPALTTTEARKNPFGLIVALNAHGFATGELYLDDGVSVDVKNSTSVSFVAESSQLTATPSGNYLTSEPLANITILGVANKPSKVEFENQTASYTYENNTIFITSLSNFTSGGAWNSQFSVRWS